MLARRRFLSLLGAAPAAIPVIAKEAAAKLGLEGALGGMLGPHTLPPCLPSVDSCGIGTSEHWAKQAMRKFWSPTKKRERAETIDGSARRLDPDLASMRSISPAAAYQLQRARCKSRIEQQNWNYYSDHLQEHLAEQAERGLGL